MRFLVTGEYVEVGAHPINEPSRLGSREIARHAAAVVDVDSRTG